MEFLSDFLENVTTRLETLETTDAKLTAEIARVEGKIGNALRVKMYHKIISVYEEAPLFGFQ